MGKVRTINSRVAIVDTASLMEELKLAEIEVIQRTYGIPTTYLTSTSLGFLSYNFCSLSVHACIHRAGAMMRKPKSNSKTGIATAKKMIITTLNQVTVALMLTKNNTK